MWLRLAARDGISVKQAQGRYSSREFAEQIAFYRLEQFGELRADARAAIVAATMANFSGHATRTISPYDIMPHLRGDEEPKQQSDEEMRANLLAFLGACSGK